MSRENIDAENEIAPSEIISAHYRHFRIHNGKCDLWSCIINSVIETKFSKKNYNQKFSPFSKLIKMWGNEVLLLLLEKTLRFETIAEVSCKNLRYGIIGS